LEGFLDLSDGCLIFMVKLLAFVILGVAYFNMGAEYEHLKKSSEALWHYQRV